MASVYSLYRSTLLVDVYFKIKIVRPIIEIFLENLIFYYIIKDYFSIISNLSILLSSNYDVDCKLNSILSIYLIFISPNYFTSSLIETSILIILIRLTVSSRQDAKTYYELSN